MTPGGASEDLSLQEPALAWSCRAAAGGLDGLGWVRSADAEDGQGFEPPSATAALPGSVAAAASAARASGEATAWEALELLFAWPSWWVAAVEHLWTAYGASRPATIWLVERLGVEVALHRDDPDRLARLSAQLGAWAPRRGEPDMAARMLAASTPDRPAPPIAVGAAAGLELVVCRRASSWAASPPRIGALRLVRGLACGPVTVDPARPEHLPLAWSPAQGAPFALMRLLPPWVTPHPTPGPPNSERA